MISVHSTYEALRQLADSWALLAMAAIFVGLAAWPFRPGARNANETAATMIFESDDHD
jgi:cytochrome c oxidase cbb3-type subunit 4